MTESGTKLCEVTDLILLIKGLWCRYAIITVLEDSHRQYLQEVKQHAGLPAPKSKIYSVKKPKQMHTILKYIKIEP